MLWYNPHARRFKAAGNWRGSVVGLTRAPGKRVYRKVSRVRIPPSPPHKNSSASITDHPAGGVHKPLPTTGRNFRCPLRQRNYIFKYFSSSKTRKAGQTMPFRKPSTPIQKVVAVLMK